MSWADKQLRKHKIHKMVESAMNDPRYQKEQKKQLDEATAKAFDSFMVISVAYLHDRQGFGKKRLLDFIDYVVEQILGDIEDMQTATQADLESLAYNRGARAFAENMKSKIKTCAVLRMKDIDEILEEMGCNDE